MSESTSRAPRLVAIAYISASVLPPTPAQLDALLLDAREFNASVGVTGVLLHNDGTFFQYIEGPDDGIARVYDRIRRSHLHAGIVELFNARERTRQFEQWHMGFCEAPRTTLQALTDSAWRATYESLSERPTRSAGLDLLHSYLASADNPGEPAVHP